MLLELQTQYREVELMPEQIKQQSPPLQRLRQGTERYLTQLRQHIVARKKELETAKQQG